MNGYSILRSALLGLLLLGCGSSDASTGDDEATSTGTEETVTSASTPLSNENAADAAIALDPLVATLQDEGMTIYSVGAGRCWDSEGICAQVEAQTGADETRIREAVTDALNEAGFTGTVEVRLSATNPRQPQAG